MSDIEHTEEHGEYTIKIIRDEATWSPSTWGDEGLFLVADNRNFYVKPPKTSTFASVVDDYKKTHHTFELEAYIHSGVVLALANEGSFPDRKWDVCTQGVVFVDKKEARTREKARELALGLIDTWNEYLSGNVYGYVVEKKSIPCEHCGMKQDDEVVESCWGYYGDYEKSGVLDEARAIVEGLKKA